VAPSPGTLHSGVTGGDRGEAPPGEAGRGCSVSASPSPLLRLSVGRGAEPPEPPTVRAVADPAWLPSFALRALPSALALRADPSACPSARPLDLAPLGLAFGLPLRLGPSGLTSSARPSRLTSALLLGLLLGLTPLGLAPRFAPSDWPPWPAPSARQPRPGLSASPFGWTPRLGPSALSLGLALAFVLALPLGAPRSAGALAHTPNRLPAIPCQNTEDAKPQAILEICPSGEEAPEGTREQQNPDKRSRSLRSQHGEGVAGDACGS